MQVSDKTTGELLTLDTLTWESALSLGTSAREAGDRAKWDLGDLGAIVAAKWQRHSVKAFASEIGMENSKRLYEYISVAEFWSKDARAEFTKLSWSHFREASRHDLDIDAATLWLTEASDKNWPVGALREAITGDPREPITRRALYGCRLVQADGTRVLLEMPISDVARLKDTLKLPGSELEMRISWQEKREAVTA